MQYTQVVRPGKSISSVASWSFRFSMKMPSSAARSKCWSLVEGCVQAAVLWICRGQLLNNFTRWVHPSRRFSFSTFLLILSFLGGRSGGGPGSGAAGFHSEGSERAVRWGLQVAGGAPGRGVRGGGPLAHRTSTPGLSCPSSPTPPEPSSDGDRNLGLGGSGGGMSSAGGAGMSTSS